MSIDPLQIIQVTLYSKIIQEITSSRIFQDITTTIHTHPQLIVLIGLLYIIFTVCQLDYVKNRFCYFDISTIVITTHYKSYFLSKFTDQELVRPVYSTRFKAILHFIQKIDLVQIKGYDEILKLDYGDSHIMNESIEFMLMPICNSRIKIADKYKGIHDIYLEVSTNINKINVGNRLSNDKDIPIEQSRRNEKYYTFIITVKGIRNLNILDEFMTDIIDIFNKDSIRPPQQLMFEYIKSTIDENDSKITQIFSEIPFKSNKYLHKNVVFEGCNEFIEFIDRFGDKGTCNELYERSGMTKKACILMHGTPGCGKSCTIKGIMNRTGRHGILVRWDRINTCSDFCSLFRKSKINNTPFHLKDFIFIFEDFDANNSDTLKTRKPLDNTCQKGVKDLSANIITEPSSDVTKMSDIFKKMEKTMSDKLTLECVLNVLDGIIEMPDAMIVFTTNHLEQIDPAFYRSGRVDYILEMKKASVSIIKEMVKIYCNVLDMSIYDTQFKQMNDYVISPADVQSLCFKYGDVRIDECLAEIITKTQLFDSKI